MLKTGTDIYSWKGSLSFPDKAIEGKGDGGRGMVLCVIQDHIISSKTRIKTQISSLDVCAQTGSMVEKSDVKSKGS